MMNTKFKYDTVSEAVQALQQKGYDKDFRLEGNYIACGDKKFGADDLKIAITYRYEGHTDPATKPQCMALKPIVAKKAYGL